MPSTYVLSIEPTEGKSFIYGFHLGTIERVARDCAVDIFKNYTKGGKITIRTVALKLDGKIVDVFDGSWATDVWAKIYEEE